MSLFPPGNDKSFKRNDDSKCINCTASKNDCVILMFSVYYEDTS